MVTPITTTKAATQNACKLCAPLGASLAYRGVEGAVAILHGSQGCATYIRRYLIGHFREPMDIASSSFSEESAVFGGEENLKRAIANVINQYSPKLIGVASTCLSETIGEDVPAILGRVLRENPDAELPVFASVSTASYRGTHADGFHATVRAIVEAVNKSEAPEGSEIKPGGINVFSGILSPADLRYIKELARDFGVHINLLPDYSETLDGEAVATYEPTPRGGTTLDQIRSMVQAKASVSLSPTARDDQRAGDWLAKNHDVEENVIGLPIGLAASDAFFKILNDLAGHEPEGPHSGERGRLIDSYVDAHKILFGRTAIVYGEEDFAAALAGFLCEIGVKPVVIASGGKSGRINNALKVHDVKIEDDMRVMDGADYADIADAAREVKPDFLLGGSKGYPISRELNIPLVRAGFPVHDRFGAQRIRHIGYRGTQELFDRIVNLMLERKQENSEVGYSHL